MQKALHSASVIVGAITWMRENSWLFPSRHYHKRRSKHQKNELDDECACLNHNIMIDSCEYHRTSPSPTKLYDNAAGEGVEVTGATEGLPVPCNIGQM